MKLYDIFLIFIIVGMWVVTFSYKTQVMLGNAQMQLERQEELIGNLAITCASRGNLALELHKADEKTQTEFGEGEDEFFYVPEPDYP